MLIKPVDHCIYLSISKNNNAGPGLSYAKTHVAFVRLVNFIVKRDFIYVFVSFIFRSGKKRSYSNWQPRRVRVAPSAHSMKEPPPHIEIKKL